MKLLKLTLIALLVSVFACCNHSSNSTEENVAEIEKAASAGREAARELVNREWEDSMQLQNKILEVKSIQSKYLIDKKEKSAEAFDSAFFSLIKTVDPELAKRITK